MSDLDQKTAAFIAAVIREAVDDCIDVAKETTLPIPFWWTSSDMRAAIIKRLEEYRDGAIGAAERSVA